MQKYSSSLDLFTILVTLAIVGIFIAIPVSGYLSAVSLQKSINAECNGNYSVLDVALNGDKLIQICRIQNQQITIK